MFRSPNSIRLSDLVAMIEVSVTLPGNVPAESTAIDLSGVEITDALPPGEASAGHLTMIDSVDRIGDVRATAVITPIAMPDFDGVQLVCPNPHDAFAQATEAFRPPIDSSRLPEGIAPTARIHATASIHPSATIGPGVIIGARCRVLPNACIMARCVIGEDCTIGPSVTLYEYTRIGDGVSIHAGSVLGAIGFGYRRVGDQHMPTAQLGYVVIEDAVEIGAAVTIDRGTYGTTRIGQGTKIDNQVMIAHNCQIGKRNLICSQVGIAGSCRTGDDVILAGQVGLKDHVNLGDGAVIGAQAGVMDHLPGNEVYLGSPATPQREQMQILAVQRRLPEMRRELKSLKKQVAALEQQTSQQKSSDPAASESPSSDIHKAA